MINRQEFITRYLNPESAEFTGIFLPDFYRLIAQPNTDLWGKDEWRLVDEAVELINEKHLGNHPPWIDRFEERLKKFPTEWAVQMFPIKNTNLIETESLIEINERIKYLMVRIKYLENSTNGALFRVKFAKYGQVMDSETYMQWMSYNDIADIIYENTKNTNFIKWPRAR